jgi:uncharacterized membrane protein YbaN (DUF454 family)
MMRAMYFTFGCLMLALGFVGAFLPVMPTTIFLIFAAWCFARSSPRLEAWLLDHPRFGPGLRQWRDHGAVPFRAKLMAVAGMVAGYGLFWIASEPSPLAAWTVAAVMVASAIYVASRPEPYQANETPSAAE